MKFVQDSFEYVEQEPGLTGMYKQIEKAARICYKTEDLTTCDSYDKIINKILIPRGHTSPLEFGTVYLYRKFGLGKCEYEDYEWIVKYEDDRYTRIVKIKDEEYLHVYITTTYRTILQGDYKDPVEAIKNKFDKDWKDDLKYWTEPTEHHHKRYSYKFVMDRVGSQSVERHRGVWGISYAQESTRYCNYSKDRFNGELTFVIPSKFYEIIDEMSECVDSKTGEELKFVKDLTIDEQLKILRRYSRGWTAYENTLEECERVYMYLTLEENWKPEDARGVLPLDVKTEFMMCAYPEDWNMFFFRRTDKHAHPHIQRISKPLLEDFKKHI